MMRIGLSGYLSAVWAVAGPATSNASRPRNAVIERMTFLPGVAGNLAYWPPRTHRMSARCFASRIGGLPIQVPAYTAWGSLR